MYKQKYLKYKRKYINLLGGLRLFNLMTREQILSGTLFKKIRSASCVGLDTSVSCSTSYAEFVFA